jgi:PAS domain S-box-containing protein
MHPIAFIDLVSFLASLAALVLLLCDSNRSFKGDVKLLLAGLLVFSICYNLFLFLEWSGTTTALDPFEDFTGALVPMWWAFVFYAFLQDIAGRDLRESEKKYRLLIDNFNNPIIVYACDGTTLVINHAAAANFGGEPKDFIGKGVREYLPDLADLILGRLRNIAESGAGTDFEDLFEIPSGKRWFLSSLQPLEDTNGKTYAVQNISYDITERKNAEEELRKAHDELELRVEERTVELVQANENLRREMDERKRLEKALMQEEKLKTLGAIAAEVSHEIRNPLVSIGGFTRRLKKKFPSSYECDIILNESKRLEKILSRIRDYLEPVEFHVAKCDINKIVTDCVNLLSPETNLRKVRCILKLAPSLSSAFVDPDILAQIFINLIRNAINAMEKRWALIISTYENDQDVCIEFKNEAKGLKIEDPETLFMPFAEGGQSIGLPLCYRLLKDMGGLLSFSQDKDFMVFIVSLPKEIPQMPENY